MRRWPLSVAALGALAVLAVGVPSAGSRTAAKCSIEELLPDLAIPASCRAPATIHPKLKLRVNGEAFARIAAGTKYTLSVSLSGELVHGAHVFILERSAASRTDKTVAYCVASVTSPCSGSTSSAMAGKYYAQAYYAEGPTALLVPSNVVTITVGEPAVPTMSTVEANGGTRGENLATGALTCTGSAFSEGTSCYVYAAPNASVPIKATVDAPLPSGWSWNLIWQPYGGNQTIPCAADSTTCSTSVTVPQLGGTIQVSVTKPTGSTAAAMYIVACTAGQTPYPGHPCPG